LEPISAAVDQQQGGSSCQSSARQYKVVAVTILQVLILDMGRATEKWQRCLEVVALVDSQQRRGLTPKLR
jgi:hypothetical protein